MAPSISNIFATVTKASKATVSYAIAHPKTSLGLATTSMTLGVFGPENLVRKPVNGIGFDREGVRAKSLAAWFQSKYYGGKVPGGSWFSLGQSIGRSSK